MKNIKQLEKASKTYYAGNPIMTDTEFDAAIIELRDNDPGNPFLKRVGTPVPGTVKVKHKIPMGSLSNANNIQEFEAWLLEDRPAICLSHKLDGSSLELIYENGSFVQAITRGDGEYGEDVTKNVLKSGNVPLSIDPSIISVRCECLIHVEDWEEHFEGDANPRNSAAGTLRRHDGRNAQYLQFYAFDALVDNNCANKGMVTLMLSEFFVLEILSKWFCVPRYTILHFRDSHEYIWFEDQETERDCFDYEIDGVVAKIDDRTKSREMGVRDSRPKGQIAVKFKPRGAETVLRNVVWQVGHTGALTPVGEVDAVTVGGTTIRRANLCNIEEVIRLNVCIGDTVEVIRAGDVIPKITRQVRIGETRKTIKLPKKCPVCSGRIMKYKVKAFCANRDCEGKSFSIIMTWIKKRNILNLGEAVVRALGAKKIDELYFDMPLHAWANLEVGNGRLGEKRAKKVVEALEKSRSVSLPDFLGSIGITGMGRSLCKVIYDNRLDLNTIDDILAIKPAQISTLNGIGLTRAFGFCNWLKEHREEVENLASFMKFKGSQDTKGGVFDGEIICFTGKGPEPRAVMRELAEVAGALVSNKVSNTTTILVITDINSTSSKAVNAKKMGIKLISPEDFLSRIDLNGV